MKNISSIAISLILLVTSGCTTLQQGTLPGGKPEYGIKHLREIPELSLADLGKNSPGEIYIIVHPSYYIFFHEKSEFVPYTESGNVVESFVSAQPVDDGLIRHLMKEYEKAEMQFISEAGESRKLVILILPGNHTASSQYLYKSTPDAYARYISQVTGGAETVFYVESRNTSTGKLTERDEEVLLSFIRVAGLKRVLVGGGYIGRCQKDVYNFLAEEWSDEEVAIVPEISAFSPADVTEATAKMLLTPDMKLNKPVLTSFIANGGVKGLRVSRPNVTNIP